MISKFARLIPAMKGKECRPIIDNEDAFLIQDQRTPRQVFLHKRDAVDGVAGGRLGCGRRRTLFRGTPW